MTTAAGLPFEIPEMRRVKCIHLVGIGGSGMSGIAEVLLNQGYKISGSDIADSEIIGRLRLAGARIRLGHGQDAVNRADVVVTSAAIDENNVELAAARERRIPVIGRAEMLAELMRYRHGIAIAGTHGKTTTTSLIAWIMHRANLDPTYVIGGVLEQVNSGAHLGASRYLVVEADESDASFLHLQPMVVVLTNVDRDHLINYEGSFRRLKKAFIEFVHNLPFYGLLVACIDDPVVRELLPAVHRSVVTYGFSDEADVRALDYRQQGLESIFHARFADSVVSNEVRMMLPGRHNVLNALAALALAREEGIDTSVATRALTEFKGVGRRFDLRGEVSPLGKSCLLVDDYGHHPREIEATIETVRVCWPGRRLVMIHQPHRYSRLADLYRDFVEVLSGVDQLLLLDVYAAGESCEKGVDSRCLADGIRKLGRVDPTYLQDVERLPFILESLLQEGDLILTQGAGETGNIARRLETLWSRQEAGR